MKSLSFLLMLAGAAAAAESIGGPVAGYLTGSRGSGLRAIVGVPGALRFSGPLALPEGITRLRLAPRQDYALAERAGAEPVALVLAGGAVDHATPLAGVLPAADWVAFSSGGAAAVLYSSAAAKLQVVAGLPDAPRIAAEMDAAAFPETLVNAAVDDGAALVAVASRGSLYLAPRTGAPRLVFSGERIASLAVVGNGSKLAVADGGAGAIFLVENLAAAPRARVLVSGLADLGDLFPGRDGESLYAAAGSVLRVSLASGTVESYSAGEPDTAAAGLAALRGSDTFLFSARPGRPGWIFYRDGDAGRVVFVPADTGERRLAPRGGVR